MKVKIGVSNRHVHIKKEHLNILFGEGYELNKERDLSQPGEFASKEFVTIKTDKDSIDHVRILGPIRQYTQVEISKTDAYKLGLNPPVRNSGDLDNSNPITIVGPNGSVYIEYGCIIATRHIHATYDDLKRLNLNNNDIVSVKIDSPKGGIMEQVYIKASDKYAFEMHIDTDDANGHLIKTGDEATIIK